MNTSSIFKMPSGSSSVARSSFLTLEIVQHMIMLAFFTLRLQYNGTTSSTSWVVDSSASNHIIRSFDTLCTVHPYYG